MTGPDRAAFHLPGHPLPALINLDAGGRGVDLFMESLSAPILLCAHHPGGDSARYLASLNASLASLQAQKPDLRVYGLSTSKPRDWSWGFPLLHDAAAALTKALELPADGDPPALRLCTMMIKEGQIARVDYPVPPEHAGSRTLELLKRDAGLV